MNNVFEFIKTTVLDVCFLAGLVVRTRLGRKVSRAVERHVGSVLTGRGILTHDARSRAGMRKRASCCTRQLLAVPSVC